MCETKHTQCLLQEKSTDPKQTMFGVYILVFSGTDLLPSLPTLHERTGFREVGPCGDPMLASLHIPVSVVGSRKNR